MPTYDDDADRLWEDDEPCRVLRCRTCGDEEVRWRQQGGGWVLFSLEPGVVHKCDLADDFK